MGSAAPFFEEEHLLAPWTTIHPRAARFAIKILVALGPMFGGLVALRTIKIPEHYFSTPVLICSASSVARLPTWVAHLESSMPLAASS